MMIPEKSFSASASECIGRCIAVLACPDLYTILWQSIPGFRNTQVMALLDGTALSDKVLQNKWPVQRA